MRHTSPYMIGKRIAHYDITSHLGSGGMGDVFEATDSRLGRSVAMKFLGEAFVADPDRVARFEREARVLASLNHPRIAAIYGFEQADSRRFLVMELVPGLTLADRIRLSPLAADEALAIGKQIAEALEVAHAQGIVHRDLKPANVKVTPDGSVKVLDFGLAKAMSGDAVEASLANSPTMMSAASMPGLILGTAPYMSPEQTKGRAVDRRTDIFAFGCVLYEMLTGRRAFDGDDVTEILGAVVRLEPDWSALPPAAGPRIRELLRWCLEKNQKNRLSDATDLRLLIEAAQVAPAAPAMAAAAPPRRRRYLWLALAAALIAASAVAWNMRAPAADTGAVRFDVVAPEGVSFVRSVQYEFLSPDGRTLAFVAGADGKSSIWVRPLDAPAPVMLQGTEGAHALFWSGDSRNIGFLAQNKIKRVRAAGGPVEIICNESDREGAWSAQGVVLIGGQLGKPLLRVPAAGGQAVPATELDPSKKEISHDYPNFFPDGRHFLYMARSDNAQYELYTGTLDSKERKLVPGIKTSAKYSSTGHLIFGRNDMLMAQPFDVARMELSGEPVPIAEMSSPPRPFYSVSTNGGVSYLPIAGTSSSQLIWFDRNGKQLSIAGGPGEYQTPNLSADGRYVAFERGSPPDIWIGDLQKGLTSRFTSDPGADRDPVWSPDGKMLVYGSDRRKSGGKLGIYQRPFGVVGEDKLLRETKGPAFPFSWSRDGKYVAYLQGRDFWALPMTETTGDPKPLRLTETPFVKRWSRISPDAHWIAYSSDERGEAGAVYVQSFPGQGAKQQVSAAGGRSPQWRPDGSELYYVSEDSMLMSVSITKAGSSLEFGAPQPLFRLSPGADSFNVSADGRFLVNFSPTASVANRVAVILNWVAGLRK
jgi:Tol biopolymer transport system component